MSPSSAGAAEAGQPIAPERSQPVKVGQGVEYKSPTPGFAGRVGPGGVGWERQGLLVILGSKDVIQCAWGTKPAAATASASLQRAGPADVAWGACAAAGSEDDERQDEQDLEEAGRDINRQDFEPWDE